MLLGIVLLRLLSGMKASWGSISKRATLLFVTSIVPSSARALILLCGSKPIPI